MFKKRFGHGLGAILALLFLVPFLYMLNYIRGMAYSY